MENNKDMQYNKDMQNESIPKVSTGMPEGNGAFKSLITTIIPTYRRPKLLRRAIKNAENHPLSFQKSHKEEEQLQENSHEC
jgi:hypothetical protein